LLRNRLPNGREQVFKLSFTALVKRPVEHRMFNGSDWNAREYTSFLECYDWKSPQFLPTLPGTDTAMAYVGLRCAGCFSMTNTGAQDPMEVLIPAKDEEEVLVSVEEDADPDQLLEALVTRSDNCVNPRCGCGGCPK
jgi:hypothetical protein